MATISKTPSGTWKAAIRKRGWPTAIKTFRTRRDAQDWARKAEDEMVRGVYIDRAPSERMDLKSALARYLSEVSPTKSPGTRRREEGRAKPLRESLGAYSLSAISPDLIAKYRDERLGEGKSNNTVRLELALLSHLYTVAIQEWKLGLAYNPVSGVRKPSPGWRPQQAAHARRRAAAPVRMRSAQQSHVGVDGPYGPAYGYAGGRDTDADSGSSGSDRAV